MKLTVLSTLALVLFPLAVAAQDTPLPDDAPGIDVEEEVLEPGDDEPIIGGVVIIEESTDGEGPGTRSVIVLEGEDLEGLELDLGGLDLGDLKGGLRMGQLKLDGAEFLDLDLDLDGAGLPELDGHLKELLKTLKGHTDKLGSGETLESGDLLKRVRDQVRKRQESQREAKAKRERESLLAALELDAESASVVTPLLDTVLATQARIQRDDATRRRGLRASSEDEVSLRNLLAAQRVASRDEARELAAVRENLRELLTVKQELALVLRGVLD